MDCYTLPMKKFIKYDAFLTLKVVFIRANSLDSDEMLCSAGFHRGLKCLPR